MVTRAVMDLLAKSLSSQTSQSRNYEFCWQSMRAIGDGRPDEPLNSVIERDIGGMAKFHLVFAKIAVSKFGGASARLVAGRGGRLKIVTTHDAVAPISQGQTPVLAIDIWEHTYHLDCQNQRADFISVWFDQLFNWEFARKNFSRTLVEWQTPTDLSGIKSSELRSITRKPISGIFPAESTI